MKQLERKLMKAKTLAEQTNLMLEIEALKRQAEFNKKYPNNILDE